MRILALDQATITTGWAVIDDGRYKQSGLINLNGKKINGSRIQKMMFEIFSVIDQSFADMIVFEDIQNQGNIATFKLLAQLQGMIIAYCAIYEYPYKVLSATTWRKQLGFNMGRSIKRNSLKLQAEEYVYNHYKHHVNNDEADAICLGAAATSLFGQEG